MASSPALNANGSVVYVGSWGGKLYAINTTDGPQIWAYTTGSIGSTGNSVGSSPALNAGGTVVCVGSGDDKLYAVNAR